MGLSCELRPDLSNDIVTDPCQAFYGTPPPDEERFKLLDRAHELGCVHWDSAALYGDSEELLGKWFQRTGKRDDVHQPTS